MKFTKQKVFGFTNKWNGRANVLRSDVGVSLPVDLPVDTNTPETKKYIAIWDTGATNTVISKKVVEDLQLIPTGRTDVETAGGRRTVHTYVVNVYLPNQVNVIGERVLTGDISGADVLIGMDIISMGDFAITNLQGLTWMSFRMPSVDRIDFVEEINDYNRRYAKAVLPEDEKRKLRNRAKRERRKR